ncbi:MAG: NAD(P)H-dependent glycerol-3-phosphate dehydrogenase [Beutenbergiaceae bacterium]
MAKVTILGAGAMGSALVTPLRARGHQVALWGTWLDDVFLSDYADGTPHPGTKEVIPAGTDVYASSELAQALAGADAVIVAVASVGVTTVSGMAAAHIPEPAIVAMVSKGFHRGRDGRIELMTQGVRQGLERPDLPVVAVGGPVKANEVAAGRATATIYAARDLTVAQQMVSLIRTPHYRPHASNDEAGVETAAPMKNVYAIAIGIADGMESATGVPWHNLRSALFAQAVAEINTFAGPFGGRPETIFGLAGVGDLEVTGVSGRNKVFGARLGSGESAASALNAMAQAGQTVEGVAATGLAVELAGQLGLDVETDLPLLAAVGRVLDGADAKQSVISVL